MNEVTSHCASCGHQWFGDNTGQEWEPESAEWRCPLCDGVIEFD
jgi:hypothetical protein